MIPENMGTIRLLDQLIKANQGIIEEVEQNPELQKEYEKDRKKLESMRTLNESLMGFLFDGLQVNAIEDTSSDKTIDIHHRKAIPSIYLRAAGKTETPRMIKNLRRLQLTQYGQAAVRKKYGEEVGFTLQWKDPFYQPTKAEKEELAQWEVRLQEKLFFPAGDTTPSLSKFLGNCYEDFFDVDDMSIEIMRDRTFYPIGIRIVDPTLWRPTIARVLRYPRHDQDFVDGIDYMASEIEIPDYEYVMVVRGTKVQAVSRDNLLKSHFFTRSDFALAKRGYSIMEQAINITTILINAITFNATNFSTDRTPMGVLAFTGGFTNQLVLEKLKKVLWASLSGVSQKRRIPIVGLPEKGDAKWVNIHSTPKELEFYTGLTLFTSIVCALSGTDPNELGLASFRDAMKGNRLNEDSIEGVWKRSSDTGLKTFAVHWEDTINTPMTDGTTIMEQIVGKPVRASIKGLAQEDMKTKLEVNTKRLATTASINDLLAEEGKDRQELKLGDIDIYDLVGLDDLTIRAVVQSKIQEAAQERQMEQQAQMQAQAGAGGQPGQPGAEGAEPYSEKDKQLIATYGEPEGAEEEEGAQPR